VLSTYDKIDVNTTAT